MHAKCLLGPAGTGKTWRCLEEIRAALHQPGRDAPLLFLAPKQATFQLERQLLADPSLPGYSRLHILSFERLAHWVFDRCAQPSPRLLDEEGRVMVLRALLAVRSDRLEAFRASARRHGFAQEISRTLREFQQHRLDPARIEALAKRTGSARRLDQKLHDLALILGDYLDWLKSHDLQDADNLLDYATDVLRRHGPSVAAPESASPPPQSTALTPLQIEALWLDGFAQMTPQERALLRALLPFCQRATLAFCLDAEPREDRKAPWYSPWALIEQTVRQCCEEIAALPGLHLEMEILKRDPGRSRFSSSPELGHLERYWAEPAPMSPAASPDSNPTPGIRVVSCFQPESEATFAAREILRYVRQGSRYRDIAVLVRQLDPYHGAISRVFARYGIPFFLDRRERVAHHPLAELVRSGLRTLAFRWQQPDWFGVLKSGLMPARDHDLDELENEALARGWEGEVWRRDFHSSAIAPARLNWLNQLRRHLTAPLLELESALGLEPTGAVLAEGLRRFWESLRVEETLETWIHTSELSAPHGHVEPVHQTVWDQMQGWLDNLELAFPREGRSLADWLPILEAGLAGLTVGVIPPVLDQVLVGAVDRSRNPDLKRALILGVNESVFPAPPGSEVLLTDADRLELGGLGCELGPGTNLRLGHERFYGYIACTRARDQVTLTFAQKDAEGRALNPSSFISHLQRLFPGLEVESFSEPKPWPEAEHPCELIAPLLQNQARPAGERDAALDLLEVEESRLEPWLGRLRHLAVGTEVSRLPPELAAELYGPKLRTSVSSIERFAHCPFRFFMHQGLHLREREKFVLDPRLQGSFQHEVLAAFHQELRAETPPKQWRELDSDEARERIGRIADDLLPRFAHGILEATPRNRFLAEHSKATLQRFIGVVIEWMGQYEFDPCQVELAFGAKDGPLHAWELDLGDGHHLALEGRIDRVDLWKPAGAASAGDTALCVVMDYKAGLKKLDRDLLEGGVQMQLPGYLNVLRHLENPEPVFGVKRLVPSGVFYVGLRGQLDRAANRTESKAQRSAALREAYTHQGLFDLEAKEHLDNRPGQSRGDQFPYRINKNGTPAKRSFCALESADFTAILDHQEQQLLNMGRRIYDGEVQVDPWKKGKQCACDVCDLQSVCRIDPWTHPYRGLSKEQS